MLAVVAVVVAVIVAVVAVVVVVMSTNLYKLYMKLLLIVSDLYLLQIFMVSLCHEFLMLLQDLEIWYDLTFVFHMIRLLYLFD